MDDEFWEHLLHKATEFVESGDYPNAIETLEQVAKSGHPDAAPKGATLLGQLLTDAEEPEPARALFEYAVASDHPVAAPKAALCLGRLLHATNDILGAQQAYGRAALSGLVGVATTAKVAIEQLHDEFEQQIADLPYGRIQYERARRLHTIDEFEDAKAAFRLAIESDDPDYAPRAAISLAMLLQSEREAPPTDGPATDTQEDAPAILDETRALLRQVVDTGHPEHGPVAASLLADLLEDDEPEATVELREISAEADDPEVANYATAKLAELLVSLERYPAAVERFVALLSTADVERGAHAAYRIGVLFDQLTSSHETAAACFRYAADNATEDIAGHARELLEQAAERNESPVRTEPATVEEIRALTTVALARDTDDERVQPVEHRDLDEIRAWAAQAPAEEVEQFCERTMDAGYALDEQEDLLAAVRAFEQVMATGHPTASPRAAARLAVGIWTMETTRGPESVIARLAELGHPHLVSLAWFSFAKRMVMGGKFDLAQDALHRASEGEVGPAAECALRILRDERDDIVSSLRAVERHDSSLVPEVLRFVDELAELRKREAAETFRTVETLATITGHADIANRATADREALAG